VLIVFVPEREDMRSTGSKRQILGNILPHSFQTRIRPITARHRPPQKRYLERVPGVVDVLRRGGVEVKKPASDKSHHRGGLLLTLVVLGGVALLVCWLRRGRCPFSAREDWTGQPVEKTSPSFATDPEGEIGVTTDDVVGAQIRPQRMAGLTDIEGIGPSYAAQLEAYGLKTTDDLLQAGAKPKGREDLAAATGISGKLILRWVNMADLFRIKGVGEEYSDLLEAAGVDTVSELAQRRADHLTKKMAEVNDRKRLVRRLPTEVQVSGWIESAKALPRMVTY
jgi:predicted flap endonuclease-1-like 5' DNA nuclease